MLSWVGEHLGEHAPTLTITQIAHDLGFSSSQYFSTVFRRYLGASPRDWRAGGKTGDDA